jgi:hypothetical protein
VQEQTTASSAATGVTKKHSRSRGRAKKSHDPYESMYGCLLWEMFRQGPWIEARNLDEATVDKFRGPLEPA